METVEDGVRLLALLCEVDMIGQWRSCLAQETRLRENVNGYLY